MRPGLHLYLRWCWQKLLPPPWMLGIVTAALKIAASEYEHVSSGSARVAAVQRTVRLKIPSSPCCCCCAGTITQRCAWRTSGTPGSCRTIPDRRKVSAARSFSITSRGNIREIRSADLASDGGGGRGLGVGGGVFTHTHTHTGYIMLHINRPPPPHHPTPMHVLMR